MKDKNLEMKKAIQKQLLGLTDGGKVALICTDCETHLMELWLTYSNEKLAQDGADAVFSKIQALCKICGGSSEVQTVAGLFSVGIASDDLFMEPIDSDSDVSIFVVDRSKR